MAFDTLHFWISRLVPEVLVDARLVVLGCVLLLVVLNWLAWELRRG